MASDTSNLYTLKLGIEYNDLFPLDFEDIFHQAFEKDRLESFTIKISKSGEHITMKVLAMKRKSEKIRGP
jgi:hypothetical protein